MIKIEMVGPCAKNGKHQACITSYLMDTWRRRKRGQPKQTGRRTIERERQDLGFQSWTDATTIAWDR